MIVAAAVRNFEEFRSAATIQRGPLADAPSPD
jgi:hypothetical protein